MIQGQRLVPRGVYQVRSGSGTGGEEVDSFSCGHAANVLHHQQGVEGDLLGLGHVHRKDLGVGFCPESSTESENA